MLVSKVFPAICCLDLDREQPEHCRCDHRSTSILGMGLDANCSTLRCGHRVCERERLLPAGRGSVSGQMGSCRDVPRPARRVTFSVGEFLFLSEG